MGQFINFKKAVQDKLERMTENNNALFVTDVSKEAIWETYLEGFPAGTNEILKERREYDCQCCKSFIRRIGNVVALEGNKLVSIWDIEVEYPFNEVAGKLSALVKSAAIRDAFISREAKIGVDFNHQQTESGEVNTWSHFHVELPSSFVNTNHPDSVEAIMGGIRDSKNVFKRSMDELTLDAGQTILELIEQGSLYRGAEFQDSVVEFVVAKNLYDNIPDDERDAWCWTTSRKTSVARIRNTAIGTLLINLSDGVELDVAVGKFEAVVAPTNYKRPNAIFTKRMVEQAEVKIKDLGLGDSLGRKFAVLDDITVDNVLFIDRDTQNTNATVFDALKSEATVSPKHFSRVEEVGIEQFIENILPSAKSIELMVENSHQSNLMSLIAPANAAAPSMLKWGNNFSWSYTGDIADSMKQHVKNAGGNVEGILRFSIQWNDDGNNENDLDAHCIEPDGNLISYPKAGDVQASSGVLDVDIVNPGSKVAVENITWSSRDKMQEARYQFLVHNFSHRGGIGFTAEIEYDGEIHSFTYDKELRQKEKVLVADINFSHADGIKFNKSLSSSLSNKEIWGIRTNAFVPVSSLMLSPNYWDGQEGKGNKHYFFFVDGCVAPSCPRGFYNEFLGETLLEHKRVFEALGSKMRVAPSDNQLSGLGFSTTQRNSVIAKIEGSFNRVIKINF